MIPEIGQFALILALLVAAVQGLCAYNPHAGLARRAAFLQAGLASVSFTALMWAHVSSDFTVLNVVQHSHTLKPLLYKISGTWGNHEGSLLLWILILALYGAAMARTLPATLMPRAAGVMGLVGCGFTAFAVLASNPFARVFPPPADGNDLNPLLQDIALALHPPALYAGYVGFAAAFAIAAAALMNGRFGREDAAALRPWVLFAWSTLSAGIALGSWWAYYELGWGGFWFWDPVENASLMPWLAGAALLHSVIVTQRRESLARWTLLLSILAFTLSLLGTFLVRSGVLTSVHSFALDPARGVFILMLLALYGGGALALYARKAPGLVSGAAFAPVSRESALLFNNLFLVTACATVLTGTLYPLAFSALNLGTLAVGPPYFHATFLPLMVPLMALMAIGPAIPWKTANLKAVMAKARPAAVAALIAGLIVFGAKTNAALPSVIGTGLGVFLIAGTIVAQAPRLKVFSFSQWGLTLAHAGLGIAVLGMIGTTLWVSENSALMKPGGTMRVGGHDIRLEKIEPVEGPNYKAARAHLLIKPEDITLTPEKRYYTIAEKTTSETSIRTALDKDIYTVLEGYDETTQQWIVHVYIHPLVAFLWAGYALMALGGLAAFIGSVREASCQKT